MNTKEFTNLPFCSLFIFVLLTLVGFLIVPVTASGEDLPAGVTITLPGAIEIGDALNIDMGVVTTTINADVSTVGIVAATGSITLVAAYNPNVVIDPFLAGIVTVEESTITQVAAEDYIDIFGPEFLAMILSDEDCVDEFGAETLVNILSNVTSNDAQKLIDAFDPEALVNILSNNTSGAVQDFIDTFSAEELIDTFGPELVANILPILRNDASSTVPNIAKRKAAGAIRDAISNIVPSIPTVAILPNDESDIISNAPEIRTKPVQELSDLVINKVGIVKASSVVIRDGKIVLVSGSESYIGQ